MSKMNYRRASLLAAAITGAAAPVAGQQAAGTGSGYSITLGFETGFRYNDNLGLNTPSRGSTWRWENRLNLGILNETQTDRFSFDLAGLLRMVEEPGFDLDTGFTDPEARLSYSRDTGNAQASFFASYAESELRFSEITGDVNLDGVIDAGDLVVDTGTRERSRISGELRTGINDPLGFSLSASHREVDYRDTTDPSLFFNRTDRVSAGVSLRLSPVLQADLQAAYIDYEDEASPPVDRQTREFSAGLTYEMSPRTTLTVRGGQARIEETVGTAPQTIDTGRTASIALVHDLKNGSASASFDRGFGTNGSRTTVLLGRAMELPNGTLGLSLGSSRGPFGDTTAVGSIDVSYNLANSRLQGSLRRDVGTSTQRNELRETRARLAYLYDLSSISSLGLTVNYVDQTNVVPNLGTDRTRANINASYSQALTQDWSMTAGVEHRILEEAGTPRASDNAVIFSLNRQFVLRP
ncbi:hypothetical protein ACUXV3_20055 (plasmid) [Roseobacteraceae bacterium NS-SX3]